MANNNPGRVAFDLAGLNLNLSVPPTEIQVQRRIDEIRTHFERQSSRYTFEGVLGRGGFGFTVKVQERLGGGRSRRFAVKRAVDDSSARELRNEIAYLQRVNGAEHIARLIAYRDDTAPNRSGIRARLRRFFRRRQALTRRIPGAFLMGLTGPVLVIEYLENNTVRRLFQRAGARNRELPNRLLWAFFLCLVRAWVGLTYPRGQNVDPDAVSWLETVPTDGTPPSTIDHGDLHMSNIMLGSVGGPFPEHRLIPPLKFIDFGEATESETAADRTRFRIARLIVHLIARRMALINTADTVGVLYNGVQTALREILDVPRGRGAQYPRLDDDLRDLLARCFAVQEGDRPSMQELLQITSDAVRDKTAAFYEPGRPEETDDGIREVLQELVYDADVDPAT
ncbi:kinase-like domain-containing protein [Xylariomycetidae sp. FL2044]|nr:kinase-like domain-containing protein [Xylariomycetidae sp. FL2044]